jgi:hypothetical protein
MNMLLCNTTFPELQLLVLPFDLNKACIADQSPVAYLKLSVSADILNVLSIHHSSIWTPFDKLSHLTADEANNTLNKVADALLMLMVYNQRIDLDDYLSGSFYIVSQHGNRMIVTTEEDSKANRGCVLQFPANGSFPVTVPLEQLLKTELTDDHVGFTIICQKYNEISPDEELVGEHSFITFEPHSQNTSLETTDLTFLKAHAKRDKVKSSYPAEWHYDFLHQDWSHLERVRYDGLLPNGNKLISTLICHN